MRCLLRNATLANCNGDKETVHIVTEDKKISKVSKEPLDIPAMDNTKRFVDMGGVIGSGNDFIEEKPIWSPVGMPMMEIELLLKAGLTMNQVVSAATVGGAQILGREDYGRIEEGCIADMIAVKGDPYELPYLLSNVNFVMKEGIVVKNE